jgi:hypothetical protein
MDSISTDHGRSQLKPEHLLQITEAPKMGFMVFARPIPAAEQFLYIPF